MAFTCVLLADSLWLFVERAFTKNSRKAGTFLFGDHRERSLKPCDW